MDRSLPPPLLPSRRTGRQLPLPLAGAELPLVAPPRTVAAIASGQVWPGLSPAAQLHLRRTLRRILQEVMGDAGQR